MEIRDPIHGSLEFTPPEVAVLDSAACQRLRSIKQLGFSEFSFPGATHNRYIHSLGASHLAGQAFDQVFRGHQFKQPEKRFRLRQALRLAALLHDIGHGPLSHTSEQVMPRLGDLAVAVYKKHVVDDLASDRRANHEDYTIKFVTGSPLTEILRQNFRDMDPYHVACIIDPDLQSDDDFFTDAGVNYRPVLCQLVSSELDVDRMDYLERDAYFCGTNYGRVELNWLIANLTHHVVDERAYLALDRRALYTFDDFLISRHHMHLMVYFHHKSIIFEEMLMRYLGSEDCRFSLPADIEEYVHCTDYSLFEHLKTVDNLWGRRVAERRPFRVVFELHVTEESPRPENLKKALEQEGIQSILASSDTRLSKYHSSFANSSSNIFVVDQYDKWSQPDPIENCTQIFQKYEETRSIERLYVSPEDYERAKAFIAREKI